MAWGSSKRIPVSRHGKDFLLVLPKPTGNQVDQNPIGHPGEGELLCGYSIE